MGDAGGRSTTGQHSSDVELVRAHAVGDPYAFAELVRRHRDRMWAVALRTTRDPDEAADALQDAFLSAHRAAASFRAESAVTTWLHRIVVNACLDRMRRRQAQPVVTLAEDGHEEPAAPGDAMADRELHILVHQALLQIPAEQRAAVVAVDIEGYSVVDAARALGVAEGTIKSRCARGRAKLAVILGHLRTDDVELAGETGSNGNHSVPLCVTPENTYAGQEGR
ncbi:MAG: RNA polymerase sigma factor SigM [Mycobacteriaceae bacterium]